MNWIVGIFVIVLIVIGYPSWIRGPASKMMHTREIKIEFIKMGCRVDSKVIEA